MQQELFIERQKFTQAWIWVIIIFALGIPLIVFGYGIIKQLVFDVPFGNNPDSDESLMVSGMVILLLSILIIGIMASATLITAVKMDGVYLRYPPFIFKYKHYHVDDIERWQVRKYDPILEFGGWGIRWWGKKHGMAYNVKGNMGLQLYTIQGKKLLIGTQKPEEIAIALRKIIKDKEIIHNLG